MISVAERKYRRREAGLAGTLQGIYDFNLKSHGRYEALRQAIGFYVNLSPRQQSVLDAYTPKNGELTPSSLIEQAVKFIQVGTDPMGGSILKGELEEVAERLPDYLRQKCLLILKKDDNDGTK